MGRGFVWSRKGINLQLEDHERAVLAQLLGQLGQMVAPADPAQDADGSADPLAAMVGIDADAELPEDAAEARLFPDAYSDDPEAAGEFRRFTERRLREQRSERVERAAEALRDRSDGKAVLDDADQVSLLTVLNDLRLVLGTRLEIEEDDVDVDTLVPPDDPRRPLAELYLWITWLQAGLLTAMHR